MSQNTNSSPIPLMVLITVLLIGASLFQRCREPVAKPPTNLETTTTIKNSRFDFSVDYPEKLKGEIFGEEGYKNRRYLRFNAFGPNISGLVDFEIEIREMSDPSLDDVVQWQTEHISSREKPHSPYDRILMEEVMILSGEPTIRHMYKYRWLELIYDEFYLVRQNDMVVIRMRVYADYHEDYKSDFEKFAESFRSLE